MVAKTKHHRFYSLLTKLHCLTVLEVQKARIPVLVKGSRGNSEAGFFSCLSPRLVDQWSPLPPCLHSSTKVAQQDTDREELGDFEALLAPITGALDSARPAASGQP